jgi:hypothetical protein
MDNINEFVDSRQKGWCLHCGGGLSALDTSRDHVPSKSILREPYPPNLPVVAVCKSCNEGYSKDEQYFVAFLASVLAGSTDPKAHSHDAARRTLGKNVKLRARIERSKTSYQTRAGETQLVWKPEQDRVDRVLVKNARGHAYFEYGEPMLSEPEQVRSAPILSLTPTQRTAFENIGGEELYQPKLTLTHDV